MREILIADDEPHVVRVLANAMQRAGYRVSTVLNGEQALARIRERAPDVLVSDIEMPRLSGKELCQQLAVELPERAFPIFVLTSSTELEHREWSRQLTNTSFLEKPVSPRKLVAVIDEHFEKNPCADD